MDNRGLTRDSNHVFFGEYAPHVNRMVAGPQKERHQDLLALADAGIVHWVQHSQVIHSTKCDPAVVSLSENLVVPLQPLQRVIKAHVSDARDISSLPTFVRALKTGGIIHSLNEDGRACLSIAKAKHNHNLWITGPLVAGSTYYNHHVPSAGSYSRAFVDADRIARQVLGLKVEVRAIV